MGFAGCRIPKIPGANGNSKPVRSGFSISTSLKSARKKAGYICLLPLTVRQNLLLFSFTKMQRTREPAVCNSGYQAGHGLRGLFRAHAFEPACARNNVDHRLTQPNHPWTNGQVERMNRTLKEATVKRYHYGTHDQLKEHIQTFLMACHFAKRLKPLHGLTPYEYLCKLWTSDPDRFKFDPFQHTGGTKHLDNMSRFFLILP